MGNLRTCGQEKRRIYGFIFKNEGLNLFYIKLTCHLTGKVKVNVCGFGIWNRHVAFLPMIDYEAQRDEKISPQNFLPVEFFFNQWHDLETKTSLKALCKYLTYFFIWMIFEIILLNSISIFC